MRGSRQRQRIQGVPLRLEDDQFRHSTTLLFRTGCRLWVFPGLVPVRNTVSKNHGCICLLYSSDLLEVPFMSGEIPFFITNIDEISFGLECVYRFAASECFPKCFVHTVHGVWWYVLQEFLLHHITTSIDPALNRGFLPPVRQPAIFVGVYESIFQCLSVRHEQHGG